MAPGITHHPSRSSKSARRCARVGRAVLQKPHGVLAPRVRDVGAEQHADENCGADDRHSEEDLERRLCGELDGQRLPFRRRQQRTALEEMFEGQSISL